MTQNEFRSRQTMTEHEKAFSHLAPKSDYTAASLIEGQFWTRIKDENEANFEVADLGYVIQGVESGNRLARIPEDIKPYFTQPLSAMADYIQFGLATDGFGENHRDQGDGQPSRQGWEKKQDEDVQYWLKKNRMSLNAFTKVITAAGTMALGLEVMSEQHSALASEFSKLAGLIKKLESYNQVVSQKDIFKPVSEIALERGVTEQQVIDETFSRRLVKKDGVLTIKLPDPNTGYDMLNTEGKKQLASDFTKDCISLLNFFGIQVEPRPMQPIQ